MFQFYTFYAQKSAMHYLYNLIIQFYGIFIKIASFFHFKAKLWENYRENWGNQLFNKTERNEKYVWIHCASSGEFEQAIPLIHAVKKIKPNLKIAVSFFSPSGLELYKNTEFADVVFSFPLDTKENSKKLIDLLQPELVIFIRNEIWWNTLNVLNKKNIRCYLVNANLHSKRNCFYKKYLNVSYPLFTKIFDTKTYGNTKLERVIDIKNTDFKDAVLEGFCKDNFVIILGSSWQTEEQFIYKFYHSNKHKFPKLKIIIAPHEYNSNKASELYQLYKEPIAIYTQISHQSEAASILFLDKMGILKYVYRYANIAIIGGGYDKTVHNVSEAIVYGIPVIIGSNYKKFEEIQDFIDAGIAFSANNYSVFEQLLLSFLETGNKTEIHKKIEHYFSQQQQTSSKIINEIL